MNTGKCHHCDRVVLNVLVEAITVNEGFTPAWKGASFLCPYCRAILSVGLDPIALKTDIVNEVVKRLGRD